MTMNYSKEFDIFFVHIPKNAGTSVKKTLGIEKPFDKHKTYQELKALYSQEFTSRPSIAVIRNPWDRMVSIYKYRKRKGYEHHLKHYDYSFEEWLFDPTTPKLSGHMEWSNQLQCIVDEGQIAVTDLLRYETLNEDWDRVADKYSLPKTLPVVNQSPGKPYQEYYTDKSIKAVQQLFAYDIEHFNYTFG